LLRQLLLEAPSELQTGRVQLCICPECGDIGCYAFTAVVEESSGLVIWRDFGAEKDWRYDDDDPLIERDEYDSIGPFRFDKEQYRESLLNPPPKPES
jgi:hypothetical protein